jgi:hypothetical protein
MDMTSQLFVLNRSPFYYNKILVLLLACLVFGLAETLAQTQSKSSQWEPAIRAFEKNDKIHPPPQNAVLFIGASSIRKWTTLSNDFPSITLINRGFGGSQIDDSTFFASRIIFPYHPPTIVLYGGDNDLAAGKSPAEVFSEYTNFVNVVHSRLPETRIIFISIKPSPSRWKRLKDKVIETNRQIAAIKDDHLVFVDVYSHMLDAGGNPQKDLFLSDGLHPNEKAYAMWASLIRPYLN